VCVALAVIWIGSRWWPAAWVSRRGTSIVVFNGQLFASAKPSEGAGGTTFLWLPRDTSGPFRWWFGRSGSRASAVVWIPLWLPVVILFAPTVALWRLDVAARRRARLGLCRECNYDRRGIPAASVCPECGAAPAPSMRA
jgi:hypothetical protein